jgi:uncharacterized membrane protein
MSVPVAIALHLVAATIWVGGMFFAYMALRPVATQLLEPPTRLLLWSHTFARFFVWVWVSIVVLPLTGYWMIFQIWGGMEGTDISIKLMHGIGWIMIFIFLFLFFVPYRQLKQRIAEEDFKAAGKALALIRKIVAVNLTLGIIVVVIAGGGRYL